MLFLDRLREELKIDEGCKYEIYLDHLELPTFGIGHLITERDDEYQKEVGTAVDEIRVNEAFEQDIMITIQDCKKVYDDWVHLPEEVRLICANMMFNLGYPRYCKFKTHIKNESYRLELKRQRNRARHLKILHEYFKPRMIQFKKV